MVTVHLFMDARWVDGSGECPVKLAFVKNRATAYLSLGVKINPALWDRRSRRVLGSSLESQSLNSFLLERLATASMHVRDLTSGGQLSGLSAREVRDLVSEKLDPSEVGASASGFVARLEDYMTRLRKPRTREIYAATLRKLEQYDPRVRSLSFEAITKDWLSRFDAWLARSGSPSRNARNIHLRNIRAVFNDAIDNELTAAYPFRRFSIRPEATVKRAISVTELRALFSADVDDGMRLYVDAFRLVFCLIGINLVDLLGSDARVSRGRLVYHRAKTGRLYSIKVEPEAAELLSRYAGRARIVSWGEGRADYRSFTALVDKRIKEVMSGLAGLSSYSMRHSWATVAAELDIPKETIAAALGHGGYSVTDIYVDFDQRKVDAANRRVLDWVFYGKR